MALFLAARYARRMARGFGFALSLGLVLALGCRSAPSEPARATPIVTPARALPAAVATVVARAMEDAPAAPVAAPSATPYRTAAPPVLAPIPTNAAVPPRRDGVPPRSAAEPAPAANPAGPYAAIPTSQIAVPRPPRAFRTPERAGDQAFVPPPGSPADGATTADGEAASAPNAARAPRAGSGVVIFRATARTALEGFDIRVTYPPSLGRFSATDNVADCTGGAGAIVTASDRGTGELRLLVASAQALPFPFDVFCRFTVAPGAHVDEGDFATRVAEVSSNAKKADPALLLVDVVVR